MKFSIIVPCYNVEAYLDRCVESIISQDFSDFELILVDDGSTDSTGSLCDRWGEQDDRVRVIHKPNGGLSDARNRGMEAAEGEYLLFVDSDDFIREESLERIARAAQGQDVIITRLVEVYEDGEIWEKDARMEQQLSQNPSIREAVLWNMTQSQNTWPSVKYAVNRAFIRSLGLTFKKGFLHEDMDWTSRLTLAAGSYGVCAWPWYCHRMGRAGSITSSVKGKAITDVITMARELCELCDGSGAAWAPAVKSRVLGSLFSTVNRYPALKPEERSGVRSCIRENRALFKQAQKKSHKIFAMLLSIIGVQGACALLSLGKRRG